MTRPISLSLGATLLGLAPGVCADDNRVRHALSVSNALASEETCGPASPAVFTVTLSGPHGRVTVQHATADGAAVASADCMAVSGTLTLGLLELSQTDWASENRVQGDRGRRFGVDSSQLAATTPPASTARFELDPHGRGGPGERLSRYGESCGK